MLRTCLSQTSRAVASCSNTVPSTIPQRPSLFHTSAIIRASADDAKAVARKRLIASKKEKELELIANKPSVVLGTRPGDEHTWPNCDLAKILVDTDALHKNSTPIHTESLPIGEVRVPETLAYGIGEPEKKLLLRTLPTLSSQMVQTIEARTTPTSLTLKITEAEAVELVKANNFARLMDLRNSNADGIAFENRRRIVAAFSTPAMPCDPGRPEVQAAILTFRIRNLWAHLQKFKRDKGNRRGLRKLVHQRAKILKYLKRLDRDRYDIVLDRLALAPESVEGELVV